MGPPTVVPPPVPSMSRMSLLVLAVIVSAALAASAVNQYACSGTHCSDDCSQSTWDMLHCYNTTSGDSQIFTDCNSSGLFTIAYNGAGCQGDGSKSTMDVGTCLVTSLNTSFINSCVNTGAGQAATLGLSYKAKYLNPMVI